MALLHASSPDLINYKPCLCVLVLDISSSMLGRPIFELNSGLKLFHSLVMEDDEAADKLEICLITCNSEVNCIQEPARIHEFQIPTFIATGTTKLVDAIRCAIDQVEQRKAFYKKHAPQYSRPMIITITDGEPDQDQDIYNLENILINDMKNKKYTFHLIGTGNANWNKIYNMCPKELVYNLNGLDFSRFFKWLSQSTDEISQGLVLGDINKGGTFLKQSPI